MSSRRNAHGTVECEWCGVVTICQTCERVFMKTFRLAEKEVNLNYDFDDHVFPFTCEKCYEQHKKQYDIIETYVP